MVDEESKERKRLYWRVCRKEDPQKTGTTRYTYPIECKAITESDKASNFYLKPLSQGKSSEKYFYIVTDPEDDVKSNVEVKQQASEPQARGVQESIKNEQVCEPQRYIQINAETNHLEAVLVIRQHKDHSAFKLKNPQDDMTYSLSRSHWLPEASLGSQPYIICCEGKALQSWRKTRSVCFERKNDEGDRRGENGDKVAKNGKSANNVQDDNKEVKVANDGQDDDNADKNSNQYIITYKSCSLTKLPFSNRLFILEHGHKT